MLLLCCGNCTWCFFSGSYSFKIVIIKVGFFYHLQPRSSDKTDFETLMFELLLYTYSPVSGVIYTLGECCKTLLDLFN